MLLDSNLIKLFDNLLILAKITIFLIKGMYHQIIMQLVLLRTLALFTTLYTSFILLV